ncbi:MAG: hypothetical protein IJC33_05345 [Clostridia bacterium]|nr:hypothetical protein [Clostridia bacterium]
MKRFCVCLLCVCVLLSMTACSRPHPDLEDSSIPVADATGSSSADSTTTEETTTTTTETTTTTTTTTGATTTTTTTGATGTTGKTTAATNSMPPPYRYSPQNIATVDELIDWVRTTDISEHDGLYDTFLIRAHKAGLCVPRYKGEYLRPDKHGRKICLMFEMTAEAPGIYYYYPEGIVRCYFIEDGLADEAKEQLVSFRNGKRPTLAAKEADSKLDVKTENLVLSDGRKVVCASYQSDDRKKATFLLNENILITVDVFNSYELSPKEVISDLSFEIIKVTTPTNSAPAASGGDIFINEGEYFVQGGKRLVDRTEPIPKEEFLKKYPVSLPGSFSTVTFYYEIPTEDGLRLNKNMSENGFIRCESKDGKSNMYIYVCQTGYIGLSSVWRPDNEPQKSRINNIDVIISRQGRNYKGKFEKDGYYYTFEMYSTEQDDVINALKDLTS